MGRRKAPLELPSAPVAPVGDLVLLTRHGFGNRIRSVASAWWLASEVGRRLQLVWHTNESCGAQLEDLFDVRPQTGDTALTALCVNSLVARSCAALYHAVECGAASGDRELLSCYEPYGSRCELHSSDLAALTADPAPVVLLTGASVPATLHNRCPGKQPARREWNARAGSKAERLHAYEHGVDGRLRGAFYRALVPSAAVREVMAPVLERVAAERLAASEAGLHLLIVGVHVRQGDSLDLKNGFFNHEPSAHDDAYVALFAAEMHALAGTCAAAGQRALFFVASDQARARRQLREALGAAALVELPTEEAAPNSGSKGGADGGPGGGADGGAEGRVQRDCRAVQHAVAEWLLLAQAVDVLIRSVRSSFSAEAALMHGVRCIDIAQDGVPPG